MSPEEAVMQTNTKNIMRAGFFWNAVYAGLNAVESALILFAISRTRDISVAGIITIGFTIGNLAAIIARYGLRNYQVTDVNETFRFPDYALSRIITVAGSVFLALVYLAFMLFTGRYSLDKSLIILEIIILKIEGSAEEVFVGRLQQQGRLDVGAKIAAVRLAGSILVIFSTLWVIPHLQLCLLLGIVVEILLDVLMLPKAKNYTDLSTQPMNRESAMKLLRIGVPLCIGMALHNYVGNAPKYLVDMYLTDELQAVCGYVMMPMFVLTILNTFVMQPAVKGLGDAWNTDPDRFRKKVIQHIMLISVLAVAVLLAGLFIGLPLLSILYKVDLLPYRKEFLILMAGGGVYTISAYLIVLLTTMRKQHGIVWGCVAAALIYLALGGAVSRAAGFTAACWLYMLANAVMASVFVVFLLIRKKSKPACENHPG